MEKKEGVAPGCCWAVACVGLVLAAGRGWAGGGGCEAVLEGCSGSDRSESSFMEPVTFGGGGEVALAAGGGD